MKSIFFLFAFFLSNSSHAIPLKKYERTPRTIFQIDSIVGNAFPQKDMEKMLRDFVFESRPGRLVGTPGHEKAFTFLKSAIKNLDTGSFGKVTEEEFSPDVDSAVAMYKKDFEQEIIGKYLPSDPIYKKWDHFTKGMLALLERGRNLKGRNLIWEKKGISKPDDIIIIGANYDTIILDEKTYAINEKGQMPGADNNASGVVCALGLIGILSEMEIPKTVRIVFFDFEELGFLGSKDYVTKIRPELVQKKIAGFVNYLMLGHDTKTTDKTKKYGNMKAYIRKANEDGSDKDRLLASQLFRKEKIVGFDFALEENSFNSSSHINFWQQGIPAIVFTQNWEDDYNADKHHTPNDFPETLNMKTLYNSFKYLSGSVIAWAFDLKK